MGDRRFIISTDPDAMTPVMRDRVTMLINAKGWDVWHWFEDTWLIAGVPSDVDRAILGKEIGDILADDCAFLVIQIPEGNWLYGRLPKGSRKWIREKWAKGPLPEPG